MPATTTCQECGTSFAVNLSRPVKCPGCGWPHSEHACPNLSKDTTDLPGDLLGQIVLAKLPVPEREYRFYPSRQWRFDLAWPERMLAVECDGGTFSNGRHTRGVGFHNDCIKCNTATVMGWRVLRFTAAMVEDGSALNVVEKALKTKEVDGGK